MVRHVKNPVAFAGIFFRVSSILGRYTLNGQGLIFSSWQLNLRKENFDS